MSGLATLDGPECTQAIRRVAHPWMGGTRKTAALTELHVPCNSDVCKDKVSWEMVFRWRL
jgi:hypothetical protein